MICMIYIFKELWLRSRQDLFVIYLLPLMHESLHHNMQALCANSLCARHFAILNSPGLKFWKAPRRKIYAIPKSDLAQDQKLKSRKSTEHDDDDFELPSSSRRSITNTLDEMKDDLTEIVAAVHDLKELDKHSPIPIALQRLISDAFKCKICLKTPLTGPPILSRCCKVILGCETCVNQWYSGEDALTKSCPLCRAQRGYTETMMLRGLNEFLSGVAKVISPPASNELENTN